MAVAATVEQLENAAKLAGDKALTAAQLRKKAAKELAKMTPKALRKAGELKMEGRGAVIFAFVIALAPAMLHDVADIVGDGIVLALNAIGGTISVVGLASAIGSMLLAIINPLYLALSATLAISVKIMGLLMIALGWIIWFFFFVIKFVLSGMIFALTAGRIKGLLQHVGFLYHLVKWLYILLLGIDNFPAIGFLPLSTLAVIGGIMLLVMSMIGGGLTNPKEKELPAAA